MADGMRILTGRRTPVAVAVVLAALVLLTLIAAGAPPARAAAMGFEAQPLPGSPGAELGFFKFDADPGQRVERVLLVTNISDKAKTIRLAPVDALAAVFGGVAYSESGKEPAGPGAWIDLTATAVDVPPGSSVEVPFTVAVPADVASGAHLGGIALWEPAAATTSDAGEGGGDEAAAQITMVTRMVLTVYVTTPGPVVPELVVEGVAPEARPDGMYLLVEIANAGTGPTKGSGTLTLPAEGFQQPIDLGDMIPGSSTRYPVKWKEDAAAGDYEAQVQLSDDGGKTATWSGTVTVADDDVSELEHRLVPDESSAAAPAGTPWLMYGVIGGLVAVVVIMALALLGRRRPRRDV